MSSLGIFDNMKEKTRCINMQKIRYHSFLKIKLCPCISENNKVITLQRFHTLKVSPFPSELAKNLGDTFANICPNIYDIVQCICVCNMAEAFEALLIHEKIAATIFAMPQQHH